MKIESVAVNSLKINSSNPRVIKDENYQRLVKSIREFPQMLNIRPIVVDADMVVLGGNMRLRACQEAGLKEVPIIRAADLTDDQKRRFIIADNVGYGEWDWEVLANEWDAGELADWGLDVPTEWSEGAQAKAQEDDYEMPDEIVTDIALGDLFQIGPHRLLCGDSTDSDAVGRLMLGKIADLCLTDPPYGLGDTTSDKNNYSEYNDTKDNLLKTISGFFPIAKNISKVIVLTPGNGNTKYYEPTDWTMAWFTPAGAGRGPWGFCCWQPILCYGKDPKLSKGLGCHPDAIVHTESAEKNGHPCPKPIGFWSWLMERTSEKGELIYEPFTGSGTTMVAAHQLNRKCYGMELDPKYCQVIIDRMLKLDPNIEIKRNGEPYVKTAQ